DAWWLLGIDGEGRGSGVEVVEWRENEESGVVESWRVNRFGCYSSQFKSWEGDRRVVPKNYDPKGERFLIASRFPTPPLACAFFSLRATVTSSSKLSRDQTSNSNSSMNPIPKGRIRRSSKQKVENSNFKENPLPPVLMAEIKLWHKILFHPRLQPPISSLSTV
nr:hypothetical protein [Tanacetum cinerariifolium]